jgi:predicted nucleic-acid-binding protein
MEEIKTNIVGIEKFIVKNGKPITKIGFDTGVLVALIDNDKEYNLKKPEFFIKKGICFVYQSVINETIGVLIHKRNYSKQDAINKSIEYIRNNNITLVKEQDIDLTKRKNIFEELKKQRKKIKAIPKPGDNDLDILASYKTVDINCIYTTNYKHFIELGKYLGIYIERTETNIQKVRRENKKMITDFFWKYKKKSK